MRAGRRLVGAVVALAIAGAAGGCGDGSDDDARATTTTAAAPRRAVKLQPPAGPRTIRARAHIPVLCYHQIRDWRASDSAVDRQYIVPPRAFAAQMAALDRHGFHPISPDQLLLHLTRGAPLPAHPVLLTFDDGTESQWTSALPVLRRHGFRATFFIMTVTLDRPNFLSRDQVRALAAAGHTIAGHTWDHHAVSDYGPADWRRQITQPTRELAGLTGRPIRFFAYPFGLWSRAAFPRLRAAGYRAAFQLSDRMDRRAPLMTLRRIIVPDWDGARLLAEMRRDF